MIIGILASTGISNRVRGYTFGTYPYSLLDPLNVSSNVNSAVLKEQGQPDLDILNPVGSLHSASLIVTSNYVSHDVFDTDILDMSASAVTASLVVTSNYVSETLFDIDVKNLAGSLHSASLNVTANYADILIFDIDAMNVGAGDPQATLT